MLLAMTHLSLFCTANEQLRWFLVLRSKWHFLKHLRQCIFKVITSLFGWLKAFCPYTQDRGCCWSQLTSTVARGFLQLWWWRRIGDGDPHFRFSGSLNLITENKRSINFLTRNQCCPENLSHRNFDQNWDGREYLNFFLCPFSGPLLPPSSASSRRVLKCFR